MNSKIRILFSIETGDQWIFQAYRGFFDSFAENDRYEIFCTVAGSSEKDELLGKYNVIDYEKVSYDSLNLLACGLSSKLAKELIEQARESSLWASPERLLERFSLFKVTLSLLQPDIVIVWNGMADIRRMVRVLLSNLRIPFFYAEKGMLPNSWYIDEAGINARCSLDASFLSKAIHPTEKTKIEGYIQNIIRSGSSAWDQPLRIAGEQTIKEKLGIDADSHVIFFPGQVDEDVNITAFSPFENVAEAVRLVLESMPEKAALVVKPHPKSKEKSQKQLAELSKQHGKLTIVRDVNVWDLIEISDLVVAINSTVAFESLLKRKKVLLLGDSVVSKVGLLEKVDVADLKAKIHTYLTAPFESITDYSKVLSFVKFLLEDYYIFRDYQSLPEPVLLKLKNKIKAVSNKMFSKGELMEMLYGEKLARFNNRKNNRSNRLAVDYFLKAGREFNHGNYKAAMEYMQRYRTTIDYSQFPRTLITSHKNDNIDISVIVVTYNKADDLEECLKSLSRQDGVNCSFEVIVVDNGQGEVNSCSQYINQYVKCPVNFNLSEGRNIGAYFARGEIVVFLDDDALVAPNYISSIKSAFDKFDIFGLRGKAYPKGGAGADNRVKIYNLGDRPFPSYCNQEGNSAFILEVYKSVGGMDPLLFGHEGNDLTYRIIKEYKHRNKVIYWPEAIIYHDYDTENRFGQKQRRYQQNAAYLKYKHGTDILVDKRDVEKYPLPLKQNQTLPGKVSSAQVGLLSESKSAGTVSAVSANRPHPKVSIITSCHNSEKFLPECIDSIRNQTMQDWELFVLDDASTDGTKSIIEKYSRMDERIKAYYFQDNKGPYVRRNFAIERANSDFIVIQDADDIMCPAKLETLYNEITTDERLGIVGSFYHSFLDEFKGLQYAEEQQFPLEHNGIIGKLGKWQAGIWHCSAIIRKELFESIGPYDENPFGADSFWLAKVAEYARCTADVKLKNIPEFLTLRRMHSGSQTQIIPTGNPRGIRGLYQRYCEDKLEKLRPRLESRSHSDAKAELKNCNCSDFVEKYGHLFAQWENRPLDSNTLPVQVGKAVKSFSSCRYVTCISRLNSMETIDRDIAKRFGNYDLLRAMAYYAIGRKEESLRYLNSEIQNHNSAAARQFISDCFERQLKTDVQSWCCENAGLYELRMIDTGSEQGDRVSVAPLSRSRPKVSVILSCYNSEKFLPECIDSIRNQTMQDWELFVLDDASTDGTKSIIEKYSRMDERIKAYYFQDNEGPYVRRNFAIERANSDFIVIQDADDIMCPAKMETLYDEITTDERLGIVGSSYRSFLDEFRGLEYTDSHDLPLKHNEVAAKFSSFRHGMSHGSAIIRKELFDAIGLYDENPFSSDTFWLAKAAEYSKHCADVRFKNLPEYLTLLRKHGSSQTQTLPTFDLRSRRKLYQRYCKDKLREVRQKLKDSPHTDIKTELKNCICSDFIEKFGHLFAKWESEPLDNKVLKGLSAWAVELFNTHLYVTCVTTLNGMEIMEPNIVKRFKNYDLLRAMAYFAIDRKEQSLTYLNREIENHNNPAARKFISDYFEGPDFAKTAQNVNSEKRLKTDVQSWCSENSKFYDLRIIDLENERDTQQEKRVVCRQNVPAPQGEQGHSCPTSSSGQTGPLVSIIMPVYNMPDYVAEAIGSVLTQGYRNFELIVVDDGSTDNTKDIILGFKDERIKYFYKENGGPYSARNLGMKKAGGDFIVPLDADDIITPDYIARHLQEFERCPDADLIYCDDCLIEEDCKPIRVIERPEYTDRKLLIRDLFRCGFPIVPFRTCIRKSVFDRIGLFDDGFRNAMDYDMIRRFVKHGLKAHHLKAPLYLRRMTPDSVSRKVSDEKVRAHFEVLRRFTESFSYDELFPDVAWDKIAPEMRQLHAKCLAAMTYLAIGQTYVKTNSPIYARTAFGKACSELRDSLKMDPGNTRIRQLLQKCEFGRQRYDEQIQQAVR